MSQTLTITVKATDGASQTFQRVGASADQMALKITGSANSAGSSLGKLDQAASLSATSVGKLDTAAARSATSIDRFKASAAVAGAAVSTMVGFLSDAARAAADEEAVFLRLQQAVENTGAAYDDYAGRIDGAIAAGEALAFADDQVAAALTNLTQTTGDAAGSLDLLGLAQDVARAKGMSLADAATLVGKVAAGNTGILQRYGIVLQDGATSAEALAAMQERFAGQAQAYADSNAGAIDRIKNSLDNLVESIGASTGDLQVFLSVLPGLSTGFTAIGGAIGALSGAGGFAGLLASINPVGLAIGGLAVTLGVVAVAFMDSKQASDAYAESLNTVNTALADVDAEGLRTALDGLALTMDDISGKEIGDTGDGWDKGTKALGYYNTALANVVDATQNADGSLIDLSFTVTKLQDDWNTGDATLADVISTMENYTKILNYTGDGHDIAAQSLANLTSEYTYGNLSLDEYSQAVSDILANMGEFDAQARANAEATQDLAIDTYRYNSALRDNATYSADAAEAAQELADWESRRADILKSVNWSTYNTSLRDNATYSEDAAKAAQEHADREELRQRILNSANWATYNTALRDNATYSDDAAAAGEDFAWSQDQIAQAAQNLSPSLAGATGRLAEMAPAGQDVVDVLSMLDGVLAGTNTGFINLADGLLDSVAGLDAVLGRFAQIDQIGKRSQSAVDIAQQVVGDPGVYAEMDDLLSAGIITLDQWNAAQSDEVAIVEANNRAQEDLKTLRFNAIDDLRKQEEGLADYLDTLAKAPEHEQAHALALMDSGNQAKIASAYSAAYAAALGDLPPEVATDLIANAAQADPVIAGLLEDFGLIERDPVTGVITVNLDAASADNLARFQLAFDDANIEQTTSGLIVVTDDQGNQFVYDQYNNLVDKTINGKLVIKTEMANPGDPYAPVLLGEKEVGLGDTEVAISVTVSGSETASTAINDVQTVADDLVGTYTATLEATDNGSTVIATVKAGADGYATVYTGDLAATDGASAVIATAQSGADAFVGTYTGDLAANDAASGIIADVQSAINALDGDTATVTVNVVQNGTIPGRGSGGQVYGGIPHAASGRVVMVGEYGPELAVLPYGTMVVPTGASTSRQNSTAQGRGALGKYDTMADVRAAYNAGKDTAEAFYGGLLDTNRQRMDELKDALQEPFDTKEAAVNALRELDDLKRARERLRDAYRRARKAESSAEKAAASEIASAVGESSQNAADDVADASSAIESSFSDIEMAATSAGTAVDGLAARLAEIERRYGITLTADDNATSTINAATNAAEGFAAQWNAMLGADRNSSLTANNGALQNAKDQVTGYKSGNYTADLGAQKSQQYNSTVADVYKDLCQILGDKAPAFLNCGRNTQQASNTVVFDAEASGWTKYTSGGGNGGGGGGCKNVNATCRTGRDCCSGRCSGGRCKRSVGATVEAMANPIGADYILPASSPSAAVIAQPAAANGITIYGNVTVQAVTADIASEISRQLMSQGRA